VVVGLICVVGGVVLTVRPFTSVEVLVVLIGISAIVTSALAHVLLGLSQLNALVAQRRRRSEVPELARRSAARGRLGRGLRLFGRAVALLVALADNARAWLILCSTENTLGTPAVASAMVPAAKHLPSGARPAIAWTHGTTGIARSCAPSLHPTPVADLPAIPRLLDGRRRRRQDSAARRAQGCGRAADRTPRAVRTARGRETNDQAQSPRTIGATMGLSWQQGPLGRNPNGTFMTATRMPERVVDPEKVTVTIDGEKLVEHTTSAQARA
jgi:hypothetical protein